MNAQTTIESMTRCTPRQVKAFVLDCLYAGLVPFIRSSPGMGKSSIVREVFAELNLKMIDHRLSTSAPEDLTGLPRFDDNGRAYFSPFSDLFPIEGDPVPEGYEGFGLFLDEANSATKMVQAASYKLVLDKQVGQYNLHPHTAIVMAGNLDTDRAITTNVGTAMQSRIVTIEMQIDHGQWLEDVAFRHDYDARIIAYLNYKPSHLMDFSPDHQNATFCCPRTWEFMNRLIKDKKVTDDKVPLYSGTITPGVATSFVQFCKVFDTMVQLEDVLKDPENCEVPRDNATKWAVVSHLMEHVDEKNFSKICTYINRFDSTFQIIFHRSVMQRQPQLRSHDAHTKAMVTLSKYLHSA